MSKSRPMLAQIEISTIVLTILSCAQPSFFHSCPPEYLPFPDCPKSKIPPIL